MSFYIVYCVNKVYIVNKENYVNIVNSVNDREVSIENNILYK